MLTGSGRDFTNPELAEGALLSPPVTIGVLTGFEVCFLGKAIETFATMTVAFGEL